MKTSSTFKNLIVTATIFSAFIFAPSITANAQIFRGEAGESATYVYDDVAHTVVISGSGKIQDYFCNQLPDWTTAPDVTIKSGITEVGYQAFYRTIGSVKMAESVRKIDDQAFIGGFSRDTDELKIYATDIGENSFMRLTNIKSIDVVNATTIGKHTFGDYSDGKIKFEKATSISSYAWRNFDNVTIELPKSLNSIGSIDGSNRNLLVFGWKDYDSMDHMDDMHRGEYINYTELYDMTNKVVSLEYEEAFYNGTALQPEVQVIHKLRRRDLIIDSSNYTVDYNNNTNVTSAAVVTITGKNPYNGKATKTFGIFGNLADAEVSLTTDSYECDGTEKTPGVNVRLYGEDLIQGVDYNVEYTNNINPGQATVTVSSISNLLRGTTIAHFRITSPNGLVLDENNQNKDGQQIEEPGKIDISNAKVTLNKKVFEYDGTEQNPTPTVKVGDTTLVVNRDYTINFNNNIEAGNATVIVNGIGKYIGTVSVEYQIVKEDEDEETIGDGQTIVSDTGSFEIVNKNEVEYVSADEDSTNVVIPTTITADDGHVYTVTSIGKNAFRDSHVESVTIPNTVAIIESNAFYGCRNLTTVNLGDCVQTIGAGAFKKCTSLEEIKLPKSVNKIEKGAFQGCKNLDEIKIKGKNVKIENNAIKGCSKKLVINVPNKYIKKYQKRFNSKTGFKRSMKIK